MLSYFLCLSSSWKLGPEARAIQINMKVIYKKQTINLGKRFIFKFFLKRFNDFAEHSVGERLVYNVGATKDKVVRLKIL